VVSGKETPDGLMNSQLSTRHARVREAEALHVSALDQTLVDAGYESLSHGLRHAGLGTIELSIDETMELPAFETDSPAVVSAAEHRQLRAFRARLYELGAQVSCLALRWALPAASEPEHGGRALVALRALDVLGAGALRLRLQWDERAEATPEQVAEASAGAVEPLLPDVVRAGAMLAVEAPHLGQGHAEFCRCLLQTIDSEWMGIALDAGELYCSGLPLSGVYDLVREFAPHVRHVACSNFRRPDELRGEYVEVDDARKLYASGLGDGDLDYGRIASLLGAVGYSGALTVDCEFRDGMEAGARQDMLRSDVAFLKDLLGQE